MQVLATRRLSLAIVVLVACGARSELGTGGAQSDAASLLDAAVDITHDVPDAGPTLVTLWSGNSAWAIAVDDTSVYWTTSPFLLSGQPGYVMKCAVDGCGGDPTTLATEPQGVDGASMYGTIALNSTNVFWVSNAGGGSVMTCAKNACDPTVIAANQPYLGGMAVNETDVYWAIDTDTLRGGVGSIMTCPVSGCAGSPTTFASQQEGPYVIALDGSNVYWATFSPDAKTTTIEKCPISGCGAPTILSSALATYSTPFAVDDASVYWGAILAYTPSQEKTTPGGLEQCATSGCAGMPTLLVDNPMLGYANAIVVDGVNVYWDEVQQAPYDTLTKCAVDGCEGNPTSLASGSQVRGIAVDSASVYWTNGAA